MNDREIFDMLCDQLVKTGSARYGWATVNRRGEIRVFGKLVDRSNLIPETANIMVGIGSGNKTNYKLHIK